MENVNNNDLIQFKWTIDSKLRFKKVMSSESVKKELLTLSNSHSMLSSHEKVELVTKIIIDAAKKSVPVKMKFKKKTENNNKWYDNDCYNLKKKLNSFSKIFSRNPFNIKVREDLFLCEKRYKKWLKWKEINLNRNY